MAENEQYVVVNKPALVDSQNSVKGRPSVVGWLEERFGFAGLVHRLDFGTSGLMVCAKTPASAKSLTRLLQNGEIARDYTAVVLGKILPNTHRDSGEITNQIDGQEAISRYRVLETFANATLVEVSLVTGRKHQIRRHFAEEGHPLLGDHLYKRGGSDRLFARPALHAHQLVVGKEKYKAPLPDDLSVLIAKLRAIRS